MLNITLHNVDLTRRAQAMTAGMGQVNTCPERCIKQGLPFFNLYGFANWLDSYVESHDDT